MLSKKLLGEEGAHYAAFHKAAEAIMTTDTTVKIAHASVRIGGKEVRLWGCCKGAGMIHPKMTLSGKPHAHDARFHPDRFESRPGRAAHPSGSGDG